jgi:phosphoribosylaminoimidazole (AIR) synthetase
MGIGLVLIAHPGDVDRVLKALSHREKWYVLGDIVKGPRGVLLY